MASDTQDLDRQLAELEDRNSPPGLLRRYAVARVALFWRRQIMTGMGVLGLVLIVSPSVALAAGVLALLGEVVDCLFLRNVPARLDRGQRFAVVERISAVTAGLQALSVSACVAMAWIGPPDRPAPAVALGFLLGAATNAGAVLPFHPLAGVARLAVYGLSLPLLVLAELLLFPDQRGTTLPTVFAALIMGYVCLVFVRDRVVGSRLRLQRRRQWLHQARDLAQANRELKDRQKELRYLSLVAKHANDSVILSGRDGRILWVNEAFTRITGYSADEAIGHRPADLLNAPETDPATSAAITDAVRRGRPHRTQILNLTRDGRRIWVGTNLVPVPGPDGQPELNIAIERDITDIKAREAELSRARDRAEQSEAAKARFLAAMSHEIRTPMNAIIGMADLLGEAELSRDNRQYVDTIRNAGEALLAIINDVLDFSKLDAGKPALHAIDFPLRAPVDSAITLLRPEAHRKGLFLDLVVAGTLPQQVHGDDVRLRQILINIVGNAVKFTARGGVTVTVSAAPAEMGHRLEIAVRDTGIGIAPDRLGHIFEEFAQADADTTRQYGGTGLGLSISRLLAREMGGEIAVTSTPGQGSCFTVTLLLEAATPERAPARPCLPPDGGLAGKTVLVAEDNRTNRLLLQKYFEDQSLTLLFAENGRQAVAAVAAHDPDIVLMDMAMPVMDGLAATREIRKTHATRPRIIALTANAFASDKATCLAAGMDGFLTKPLRKSDLLRALAGEPPAVSGQ